MLWLLFPQSHSSSQDRSLQVHSDWSIDSVVNG
jgi:hypothetical protein